MPLIPNAISDGFISIPTALLQPCAATVLGVWGSGLSVKELVASNRILVSTKAGVQEILIEDESKITREYG